MTDIEDMVRLRALADAYSCAVTVRDAASIAGLFTEDAEWSVGEPMNLRLNGNQAIGNGIASGLQSYDFLVQMVHSVKIALDGDSATLLCVVNEMGRQADGSAGLFMLGLYDDEAIRTKNGWRFARRCFRPIYLDRAVPIGLAFPVA